MIKMYRVAIIMLLTLLIVPNLYSQIEIGSTSYSTLKAAFDDINAGKFNGDITILVTKNCTESSTAILNGSGIGSAKYNSVTIKTNGYYTIEGSFTGAVINIKGSTNFTLDGSGGTENERKLTIYNSASSGTRGALQLGSGGIGGGKNMTIKNCVFKGYNYTSTSQYVVGIATGDGSFSYSSGSPSLDNLHIYNNQVHSVRYGMVIYGTSSGPLKNLLIEKNEIGSDNSSEYVYQYGMDVQYAPDGYILNNKIYNMINSTSYDKWAMRIGGTQTPGINVIGNNINKIKYGGTGGWGSYGIFIYGGNEHKIMNNMISEITSDRYSYTSTTYNPFAIRITSGNSHKIWHNTINMIGEQENTNTSPSLIAAICITTSSVKGLDVRNNIINQEVDAYKGTVSSIFYLPSTDPRPYFEICENNIYNIHPEFGNIAALTYSKPIQSIDEWRDISGFDRDSKMGLPTFVDKLLPHLEGNEYENFEYMTPRIDEVKNDFDGEDRKDMTYYGADEMNFSLTIDKNLSVYPNYPVYCNGYDVEFHYNAKAAFDDGVQRIFDAAMSYQWFKNDMVINGETERTMKLPALTQEDSATYYAEATYQGKIYQTIPVSIKVEEPMKLTQDVPPVTEVCNTHPTLEIDIDFTGTYRTISWEKFNSTKQIWETIPNTNTKNLLLELADPVLATGRYRAKVMGPGNCGPATIYSSISDVTIKAPIVDVTSKFLGDDPTNLCQGQSMEFTGSANGTIYGYQWQFSSGGEFVDISPGVNPTANTTHLKIDNITLDNTGKYRLAIYGSDACNNTVVYTEAIDITVNPPFAIAEQPQQQVICEGEDAIFSIYAEGKIVGYQWYKDGVPLTLDKFEYAQSQILRVPEAKYEAAGIYYCVMTIIDCGGVKDVVSSNAALFVASKTVFTEKPRNQVAYITGDAFFTFRAHVNGAPEDYRVKVQWYKGDRALEDDGRIMGAKSQILQISNVHETDFGDDYRVVVTGLCGDTDEFLVTLSKSDIVITKSPEPQTVCEGSTVVFTVEAASPLGTDYIAYKWVKDNVQIYDLNKFSGTTTNTLTITDVTANEAGEYYAIAYIKGTSYEVSSVVGDLTVNLTAKATMTGTPNIKVQEDTPSLTLDYQITGNYDTYQWYHDGNKINSGTAESYIIDSVKMSDAGEYYLELTNECGTTTSEKYIVEVTEKQVLSITTNDASTLSINTPNPHPIINTSDIEFYSVNSEKVKLSLYDVNGRELAVLFDGTANVGLNKATLNIDKMQLTTGTYILVLKTNNQIVNKSINIFR